MAERKVFDFYKRIPAVGFVYGAVRGIVYAVAGDVEEFKHSWEMDPADLNPLRMPRNIINGVRNIVNDLDEGIWIGKRSLGDQPLSLTFSPGFDVHHWCIQIDATIYEIEPSKGRGIKVAIISKNNDSNSYKQYCSRFSWTRIPETVRVSTSILKDYARSFEGTNYHLIFVDGNNCQTFVTCMLAKAADISLNRATVCITLIMPNLII